MKITSKKKKAFIYIVISFFIIILIITIYIILNTYILKDSKLNNNINKLPINTTDSNTSTLNNNEVIKISDTTKVRIINYYDETMFKGKKSLLIMFGTWCHNCQEELDDLDDIVNYYKGSDINVVLIAHEFEKDTLINYLQDTDIIYETEIYLDLGRVIRKAIDPDAGTVPISYLLDKNLNIVYTHNEIINLDTAKQLVNKYLK